MKAYIHAFQGRPWNEECEAALNGFTKLGIECRLFSTNEELDERGPEDIVVGGILMMTHVLNENGITTGEYNYPKELSEYRGRRIWSTLVCDLKKESLPIFIKPVEEKAAKGIVIRSWEDASEYGHLAHDAEILCSEVVNFISEWRCFVRYGKIVGIRFYYVDESAECDRSVIEKALNDYKTIPAGCSLDFGVTDDGRTLLIEMNDGLALGCYGLPDDEYSKLLMARWAELNGTKDPFWDC